MSVRLVFTVFILAAARLAAQGTQEQPSVAFPFNVPLFTPDSAATNTRQLFKNNKKPVVLAFWLTTCGPCKKEFAAYKTHMDAWQKEAPFRLVAISIDFPQRFGDIKKFVKAQGLPFEVYWDRGQAFREIMPGALNGLPQVFLFDKKGTLVWRHKGYRPGDEAVLFDKIKALR